MTSSRRPLWQGSLNDSPQEDLSFGVELSRRNESEPGVEAGWTPLAGHMAGEQLGGTLIAHQHHDLSHDLPAVTLALVAVVDDQLPENHGPLISGGWGSTSQLSMTNPTGCPSA